ncbi:MHS family MFS transporter [Pseudonocardia kujensis]|uniref:MFS transporter n=1 Tax=Pseudonocardia kujensis TaxID=1128675 RepID=UPI001E5A9417|nr:MFS transporter [Pseudonocardia kujensis]MCE0763035.1 MHS family MFS transporter [Pseudonocardia kujensis]
MSTAVLAPPTPAARPGRTATRRINLASMAGTTIEFYDYFIYGTAAALVFPKVFFPHTDGAVGAIAAFGTFALVYVFRPVGSILFGHVGDRLGRKRTLIVTLVTMGLCTVAVGLMPGAATIGVAAPILLVVLRAAQGLAVGGEWAGAALFATENAPDGQRGRFALYPQVGATVAFALAAVTFLAVDLGTGETSAAFLSWGWRVPFLLSALLIGVGLYVRLHTEETPVFTEATRTASRRGVPFLEVWRHRPRTMLLATGLATGVFACMSIATAYLTGYATGSLGMSKAEILVIDLVGALVSVATTASAAVLSDRLGRRRVVLAGCLGLAVWSLVLFPLLDTRSPVAIATGIVVLLALVGPAYGPLGAYVPEMFPTRYRYTGAGMSYNLGGVAGGALILLVAAPLTASAWGPTALGVCMAGLLAIALGCLRRLPETHERSLTAV